MFLIKDLPADVCEQCGETYLSPEIVERSEMATEFISIPVLSLA